MKKTWCLGLVLLVLSSCLSVNGFASNVYYDNVKYKDNMVNNGLGKSDETDLQHLSWSEPLFLDAYQQLDENYRFNTMDTYWLDKTVDHVDRVLASATDWDGDGRLGWNSLRYGYQNNINRETEEDGGDPMSANLIANASFEDPAPGDATLPAQWERINGDSANVYVSGVSGESYAGSQGLVIRSDGDVVRGIRQELPYAPQSEYEISFYVKVNDPAGDVANSFACAELYYEFQTTVRTLATSKKALSKTWDRITFWSKVPSYPHEKGYKVFLKLSTCADTTSGHPFDQTVYFDQVEVKETSASVNNLLVNGSFEEADEIDATLPNRWLRQGDSGYVYRSEQDGHSYSGYSAVVTADGLEVPLLQQSLPYTPSHAYSITLQGKTASSSTYGVVEVVYGSSGIPLAGQTFQLSNWSEVRLDFVAPDTPSEQLILRLSADPQTTVGQAVYYDNVRYTQTGLLPEQLVKNAGFEQPEGTVSNPAEWERVGQVWRDLSLSASGDAALTIGNNGTGQMSYVKQRLDVKPGMNYRVFVSSRVWPAAAQGKIELVDGVKGKTITSVTFNQTSWGTTALGFTAPEDVSQIDLRLTLTNYKTSGWQVRFDDVRVVPESRIVPELLSNSKFETVSGLDATLPLAWERFNATVNDVRLSSDLGEGYQGSRGVVVSSDGSAARALGQRVRLQPNAEYTASVYARSVDYGSQTKLTIVDEATQTPLASVTGSTYAMWQPLRLTFKAPSMQHPVVSLRLESDLNASVFYDQASLVPVAVTAIGEWALSAGERTRAYRTNRVSDVYAGDWAMVLQTASTASGSGWGPRLAHDIVSYDPGVPYGVKLVSKGVGAMGRIEVVNKTSGQLIASKTFNGSGVWQEQELGFVSPANTSDGVEVRIALQEGSGTDVKIAVDDVYIARYTDGIVEYAQLIEPIARFIRTVKREPLHANYQEKADQYLAFIETQLLPRMNEYWVDIGADQGAYVFENDLRVYYQPNTTQPHNRYLKAAEGLLVLYDVTENPDYLNKATRMFRLFKTQLRPSLTNPDAYEWNYWDRIAERDDAFYTETMEDTSHANIDVSAVLEAYRRGIVFDHIDMEKIAKTFTDVMWNGSLTSPAFGKYINQKGTTLTDYAINSGGVRDWYDLIAIDPDIWNIAANDRNKTADGVTAFLAVSALLDKWNPETVRNKGFELADPVDASLPAFWKRTTATAETAYRDTSQEYRGEAGFTIKSDGSGAYRIVEYEITGYQLNSDYELRFAAKTDGTDAYGRIVMKHNGTTIAQQSIYNSTWQTFALPFKTPETSGSPIKIQLYTKYNTRIGGFTVDDLRAVPNGNDSWLLNGGFESGVDGDITWPKYWSRGSVTEAAYAYRDAASSYRGGSGLHLVTAPEIGEQKLIQTLRGYKAGAAMRISFYGKTIGIGNGGKVTITNATTGAVLAEVPFMSTTWQLYSGQYQLPTNISDGVQIAVTFVDSSIVSTELTIDEMSVVYE